jgi:aerobic-type carbon monoxide dehydrogenase small subunit (CoxS/CutS family)
MSSELEISFILNGQARSLIVAPSAVALSVLRDDFDLTAARKPAARANAGPAPSSSMARRSVRASSTPPIWMAAMCKP